MSAILGLDFGGTKLAAGIVDSDSGAVLASMRAPTPAGGAEAGMERMIELGQMLCAKHPEPISAVGVSFGGPVESDGRTVRLSMHIPGWESFPLAARCEQTFGVPARIANDADAAALAEYRFGAGHGCTHMLYMTVSTGIGGGVIITPALCVLTDMPYAMVLGTTLASMVPPALVSVYTHHGMGNVVASAVVPLVIGSALGSFASGQVAVRVPEEPLQWVFAIVLFSQGALKLWALRGK